MLDAVSPAALPLEMGAPPMTPAWPMCRINLERERHSCREGWGPLQDPWGTHLGRVSLGSYPVVVQSAGLPCIQPLSKDRPKRR